MMSGRSRSIAFCLQPTAGARPPAPYFVLYRTTRHHARRPLGSNFSTKVACVSWTVTGRAWKPRTEGVYVAWAKDGLALTSGAGRGSGLFHASVLLPSWQTRSLNGVPSRATACSTVRPAISLPNGLLGVTACCIEEHPERTSRISAATMAKRMEASSSPHPERRDSLDHFSLEVKRHPGSNARGTTGEDADLSSSTNSV